MLPQAELGLRMSPRGMRTFRQLSKKASPIFWCYKDGLFESLEGSTHRSSDGSPGPFPRPQSPLGEDAASLTSTTKVTRLQSGRCGDSRGTALRDKQAMRSHGQAVGGSRRGRKGPFYRARRRRAGGVHRSSSQESDRWNRLQVRAAPHLLDRRLRWGVCVRAPSPASWLHANGVHSLLPSIRSLR